jgi:tetratricopeptide (TPR) repeat protein
MEPRVFISHSSKDKSIADAICNQLESAGIRCWIAPRNIEVGSDWTRGIMQGLAECQVFVLVFTADANVSEHVGREVAKAFSLGSAVIPFRVEGLYRVYRDYERVRIQLAIARRRLPNDVEAITLEAFLDCRLGNWEKAIQEFNEGITRDPRNSILTENLALTFSFTRQFSAADRMFDRLIELRSDQPIVKVQKPVFVTFYKTGDDSPVRSALAALPASIADARDGLSLRLTFALVDRDWLQAKELIEKMKGIEDDSDFAYGEANVPVGCYSILVARLEGEQSGANASFAETRERLEQKVQKSQSYGKANMLSQLAVVDALLNDQEIAISEAKRAVELLPISKDALAGPAMEMNLAVVYAWTNELDLAFEKLNSLTKIPNGIFYGQLKRDPYREPLRKDPRYEKLLAELAPQD